MKNPFGNNLGLKLLALALATVLYYTLKTSPNNLIRNNEGPDSIQHP